MAKTVKFEALKMLEYDGWFEKLSANESWIWTWLLMRIYLDSKCGIFQVPFDKALRQSKTTFPKLVSIFKKFKKDNHIDYRLSAVMTCSLCSETKTYHLKEIDQEVKCASCNQNITVKQSNINSIWIWITNRGSRVIEEYENTNKGNCNWMIGAQKEIANLRKNPDAPQDLIALEVNKYPMFDQHISDRTKAENQDKVKDRLGGLLDKKRMHQ